MSLGGMLAHDDILLIAGADYGRDADAHRMALERLAGGQPAPVPLGWVPLEVLNLTLGQAVPGEGPGARRAHLRRAFCAWALLRAAGDEPGHLASLSLPGNLAALHLGLEGAGAGLHGEAAGFLAWLAPRLAEGRHAPFVGVALLWHGLRARGGLPGHQATEIAEWTMAAEARAAHRHRWSRGLEPGDGWLVALCDDARDSRAWQGILARLAALPETRSRPGIAAATRLWAALAVA